MKSTSRFAYMGVALAALLLTPALASAERGYRHYDRGDRYVRSSSRSSVGVSIGFGWNSGRHSRSHGSISYHSGRPSFHVGIGHHVDYSPRYHHYSRSHHSYDHHYSPRVYSPRIYHPAPVIVHRAPVIIAPPVVYRPPTYYYAAPRTHYYTPTYSHRSYDYCAPRYYHGR